MTLIELRNKIDEILEKTPSWGDVNRVGIVTGMCDEAVYRWNTRKMSGSDCFKDMFKASIGVVDYEMVKQIA